MSKEVSAVSVFHSAFDAGFYQVAFFCDKIMVSANQEMERAFKLTNTIHDNWWECCDINWVSQRVLDAGGARSTSVGDYMRVEYADGDIEWYVVAGCGFELIKDDTEVTYEGYTYYKGQVLDRTFEKMTFRELRNIKSKYSREKARAA